MCQNCELLHFTHSTLMGTDKDPNRVEVTCTIVMMVVISCVAVLVVMFRG